MRVYEKYIAFLVLGVLALNSSAQASISGDMPVQAPSYDELEKQVVEYPLRQLHTLTEDDFSKIRRNVYQNLDPRCLTPGCRVVMSVIYADNGVPRYRKVTSDRDTPADDFYCEQAIWENMLPSFPPQKKQINFEFVGGANNDYGEHPELLSKRSKRYVTLHLIPEKFRGSDIWMPLGTLSSPKNVLHLSVTKLDDPRLEAFRLEWFRVLQVTGGYENLVKAGREIRKKYADLFR